MKIVYTHVMITSTRYLQINVKRKMTVMSSKVCAMWDVQKDVHVNTQACIHCQTDRNIKGEIRTWQQQNSCNF